MRHYIYFINAQTIIAEANAEICREYISNIPCEVIRKIFQYITEFFYYLSMGNKFYKNCDILLFNEKLRLRM